MSVEWIYLCISESTSDAYKCHVTESRRIMNLPVQVDVGVELVQVPVGDDDGAVRSGQRHDRVDLRSFEVRVKIEWSVTICEFL